MIQRRPLLQSGLTALLVGSGSRTIADRAGASNSEPRTQVQSQSLSQDISDPEEFISPLWTTQFNGRISLAGYRGSNLYITQKFEDESSSPELRLRSFDLQTGNERWSRDLSALGISSSSSQSPPTLAVQEGTVFVFSGAKVATYEATSGEKQWEFQFPAANDDPDLRFSYQSLDKTILLTELAGQNELTQNRIVGVNPTTGNVEWRESIKLPGAQFSSTFEEPPGFTDAFVMFSTDRGHQILRVDPTSGNITRQETIPLTDPIPRDSLGVHIADLFFVSQNKFAISRRGGFQSTETLRVFPALGEEPEIVLSGSRIQQVSRRRGFSQSGIYAVKAEEKIRGVKLPANETLWEIQSDPAAFRESFFSFSDSNKFVQTRITDTSTEFTGEVIGRSVSTGEQEWIKTVFKNAEQSFISSVNLPDKEKLLVSQSNGVYRALDMSTGQVGEWAVSLPSRADFFQMRRGLSPELVIGRASIFVDESVIISVFPKPAGSAEGGSLSVTLSESSVLSGERSKLTVEVTDAATGEAVSGVTVSIAELELSATTGSTGAATLSLTDPNPGKYTVSSSAEGYTAASTTLTVAESMSVIDKYDTNNDGHISITELGQAGRDFASGELSITELGKIGSAFASR